MSCSVIDLTSPEAPSRVEARVRKKRRPLVRLRRVQDKKKKRSKRRKRSQIDHADFFSITQSGTSAPDNNGNAESQSSKSISFNARRSRPTGLPCTDGDVTWGLSKRRRRRSSDSKTTGAVAVKKTSKKTNSRTATKIAQKCQVWTYKYCPTKVSELATHHKKLAEVRQWMTIALSDQQPTWSPHKLLILQGPAGIGKSTMAMLLAKEMSASIRQWKGRRSQASNASMRSGPFAFGMHHAFPAAKTNELDEFREFLLQSNRYRGLMLQKTTDRATATRGKKSSQSRDRPKELILIDAFPYLRNDESKDRFIAVVERFLQTTKFPAVIIFTETIEGGHGRRREIKYNNARKFLSPAIMDSPGTSCISVNPVAQTFMVNALKRVLECDRQADGRSYDVVTRDDLVAIARSARGDLRHAVNSLQFFANGSTVKVEVRSKRSRRRAKTSPRAAVEANIQAQCGRSNFFDPLHSINKIIYSKLLPETLAGEKHAAAAAVAAAKSTGKPIKHRRDVERVLLESQYPLYISLAFVHHNCPRQFSRVEDLASMAETLSDCDMFQPHMWNNTASLVFPRRYFATLLGNSVAMNNREPASRSGRGFGAGAVRRPPQLDMFKLRRNNHDLMKSVFADDGAWSDRRTGRLLDRMHYVHRIIPSDPRHKGSRSLSPRQRHLIASMHQYSAPYGDVPPPGSRNHRTGGVWGEWSSGMPLLAHNADTSLSASAETNVEARASFMPPDEDIEEW